MEISALQKKIVEFRDKRNWKQFHNPKDMALSLILEASEVLELFQWKSETEQTAFVKDSKERIAEELSDVLSWVLLMSYDFDINIIKAFNKKMVKNAKKYPVRKSRNSSKKYNSI